MPVATYAPLGLQPPRAPLTHTVPTRPRSKHVSNAITERSAQLGNRAVSIALSPAVHTTTIDRFVRVPLDRQRPGAWEGMQTDLRVSDDGRMAVADSAVFEGGKDLFLAAEVLADTNARLADIHSPLAFTRGSRTLEGRAPGVFGPRVRCDGRRP